MVRISNGLRSLIGQDISLEIEAAALEIQAVSWERKTAVRTFPTEVLLFSSGTIDWVLPHKERSGEALAIPIHFRDASLYGTGMSSQEDLWKETLHEIDHLPDYISEGNPQGVEDLPVYYQTNNLVRELQRNNIIVPRPYEIIEYLSSFQSLAGFLPIICTLGLIEFGQSDEVYFLVR